MSKHTTLGICLREGSAELEALLVYEEQPFGAAKENGWGLPGGKCCDNKLVTVGCCEEKPEQTMLREGKEETGFDLGIDSHILTVPDKNPETGNQFARHIFQVSIIGGALLNKKVARGSSPQWFPLGKLPGSMYRSHKMILLSSALHLVNKGCIRISAR